MQRVALASLLCAAHALLAPVTARRRSVERRGFFDDLQKGMDNLIVSDLDESRQGEPQPPPEKDERDPVEKLFGFFFGEVEAAPMGMTRMSVETNPSAQRDEARVGGGCTRVVAVLVGSS